MVDVFAEKGVLFAEAFMYRFHPQHQIVRDLIADGAIGDVTTMSASFTFPIGSEDNIRLKPEMGGGALMDVGCYCINSMRLILGAEPISGTAQAHFGNQTDVDETIAATLQFPNNIVTHFDASVRTQFYATYEVRGSKGRIHVPSSYQPDPTQPAVVHLIQGDTVTDHKTEVINQYVPMVEDFADALMNDRAPRFAPQDAVENMRVIDMLLADARENDN